MGSVTTNELYSCCSLGSFSYALGSSSGAVWIGGVSLNSGYTVDLADGNGVVVGEGCGLLRVLFVLIKTIQITTTQNSIINMNPMSMCIRFMVLF